MEKGLFGKDLINNDVISNMSEKELDMILEMFNK